METNSHLFTVTGGFEVDASLKPIRDIVGNIVGFKRPDGTTVKLVVSLEEMSPDELKVNYRTTESEMEKERGDLVCDYCVKANLKIDAPANSFNLCTLDHVIPRAKGGDRFSLDNLVVCCHPCNQKKGVKSYSTFKKQFDTVAA